MSTFQVCDPNLSREELSNALAYLDQCGIFVPYFPHRIYATLGKSLFTSQDGRANLRLGCYPTRSWTKWFVIHELVHVLVHFYQPNRSKNFAAIFGGPQPDGYNDISNLMRSLTSVNRPTGFPSQYAQIGGDEEHLAELVAFMYTSGRQFASKPPQDLQRTWNIAWKHGLSLMTSDRLPRRRSR